MQCIDAAKVEQLMTDRAKDYQKEVEADVARFDHRDRPAERAFGDDQRRNGQSALRKRGQNEFRSSAYHARLAYFDDFDFVQSVSRSEGEQYLPSRQNWRHITPSFRGERRLLEIVRPGPRGEAHDLRRFFL